jgi:uncharacterized protein YbjT (DUF2867 family)
MHNQKVEASVFGATGLVGSRLIEYLKKDPDFVQVNLVVRSPIKLNAKKIKIHKINLFKKSEIFKTLKTSKVVFLSIGTTMSKVKGDIDRYERIDFGITKDVADSCKELGVDKLILVSSSGADLNSKSFYLKLKGKIEKYVSNINLKSVSIIRPSLLLGKRNEKRFGEKLAQMILPKISFLMPSKYKPISAEKVAKAMIQLSKTDSEGVKIFNYAEIINLLDK